MFLPCPPGALMESGGEDYFCSLNFNLAGQSLPPSPIATVTANCPVLCWGVLLFDVLVMNPDRHNQNLSYDRTNNRIQIFDHSRAFLPNKAAIDSVIIDNRGKLGFHHHCLKDEIFNMDGFNAWVARIKALPDYFIEEAVKEICAIGFPSDKRLLTIEFFKDRRNNIDSIIQANISQFPKLPQPVAVIPPLPPLPPMNPPAPVNPAP
jgi:hypothetical protein